MSGGRPVGTVQPFLVVELQPSKIPCEHSMAHACYHPTHAEAAKNATHAQGPVLIR